MSESFFPWRGVIFSERRSKSAAQNKKTEGVFGLRTKKDLEKERA
jgi:hypothetical protein